MWVTLGGFYCWIKLLWFWFVAHLWNVAGTGMKASQRKKVITSILAVVPIIKVLEFAFRPNSLHKLHIYPSMHIRIGSAACISLCLPGDSEFSVVIFQPLGMPMVQWNKCIMCWIFWLMLAWLLETFRSWAVISMHALGWLKVMISRFCSTLGRLAWDRGMQEAQCWYIGFYKTNFTFSTEMDRYSGRKVGPVGVLLMELMCSSTSS